MRNASGRRPGGGLDTVADWLRANVGDRPSKERLQDARQKLKGKVCTVLRKDESGNLVEMELAVARAGDDASTRVERQL